jgi:hypothetical protein
MKKDDARKLDHKTLEAMRERAVRCVQNGESPEVVLGFLVLAGPPCTDGWRNIGVAVGAR